MRTKIIATVGPSCLTKQKIESLIQNGVTCFRVNLSHGTKSEKSKCFDLLRSCKLKSGIRPTILADLAGPKIRVTRLKNPSKLKKDREFISVARKEVKMSSPFLKG